MGNTLDACFILVSYSSEGIVPVERLVEALAGRGEVSLVRQGYKRLKHETSSKYQMTKASFEIGILSSAIIRVSDLVEPGGLSGLGGIPALFFQAR
ncbi:MAG: hypothetical protein HYX91_04980 [Chloroflexi bacterium]|nr:hypothetical protein [Chloroflexota bacterium]